MNECGTEIQRLKHPLHAVVYQESIPQIIKKYLTMVRSLLIIKSCLVCKEPSNIEINNNVFKQSTQIKIASLY